MRSTINKLRYVNLLLLLVVVYNSFSVTHYNYELEWPIHTAFILSNYRSIIIVLLIIEGVLLIKNRLLFLKMNIYGKVVYVLSLVFVISVYKVCKLEYIVKLQMNYPYLFSLMKKSYPLYGIIISIVVFFLLSYLSNIRFGIEILKKRDVVK